MLLYVAAGLHTRKAVMGKSDHSVAHSRLRALCKNVVLVCLLAACASPGTKVQVDRSSLARLERLGITVTKNEEFSVVLARDQPLPPALSAGCSVWPCALLVVVDLAVITVHKSSMSRIDADHTARLKPALGAFEPTRLFAEGIVASAKGEQPPPAFVKVSADEKSIGALKAVDGVLEVSLKHWGLRRCGAVDKTTFDAEPDAKLQVSFYITARVVPTGKTEPVWERQEFYVDNDCRSLAERSAEGVLAGDLSRAIAYLSGKMANEIRYP
jgi:hypothetical protein